MALSVGQRWKFAMKNNAKLFVVVTPAGTEDQKKHQCFQTSTVPRGRAKGHYRTLRPLNVSHKIAIVGCAKLYPQMSGDASKGFVL
jgi:hypothetical protein